MTDLGAVLNTIFGLTMIWIVVYCGWRPYRIDNIREKLFELRNELFLIAADENVAFDSQAYCILRNRLNALIRYAHTITLSRLILFGIAASVHPNKQYRKQQQEWAEAVERLEPASKQKVMDIHYRMHTEILSQVFSGSPILWIMFALYFPVQVIHRTADIQSKAAKDLHLDVEILEQQAVISFKRAESASRTLAMA